MSLVSLSLQLVLAALSGNTETETEAQQAASGSPGLAPAPMRAMSRGRAVFQNCPPEPEHRHHLEFAIHQHQPDDISRQFMNVFFFEIFLANIKARILGTMETMHYLSLFQLNT